MRRDAADTRMLRALVASARTRARGFACVAALLSAGCATTVRDPPVRVAVPEVAPQQKPEASSSESSAPVSKRSPTSRPRPPDAPGLAELGKELYERQGCSVCHSVDGEQKIGPTFKGLFGRDSKFYGGVVIRVDDAYLRESILDPKRKIVEGHSPSMPNYGQFLTTQQVRALIAYIVTLQ
jgi:cytochrome c2